MAFLNFEIDLKFFFVCAAIMQFSFHVNFAEIMQNYRYDPNITSHFFVSFFLDFLEDKNCFFFLKLS